MMHMIIAFLRVHWQYSIWWSSFILYVIVYLNFTLYFFFFFPALDCNSATGLHMHLKFERHAVRKLPTILIIYQQALQIFCTFVLQPFGCISIWHMRGNDMRKLPTKCHLCNNKLDDLSQQEKSIMKMGLSMFYLLIVHQWLIGLFLYFLFGLPSCIPYWLTQNLCAKHWEISYKVAGSYNFFCDVHF